FTVSKRVHNFLHEDPGDGGELGVDERDTYERVLGRNRADLARRVHRGDLVMLHDPQSAGLAPAMRDAGALVVWRCHVGVDQPGRHARAAWEFLEPYLRHADRYLFTCRHHVWDNLDDQRVALIAPSIDPFTPKNQTLRDGAV